MISCFLQGGLGNQMFQIAATVSHAKKLNSDYFFDFNKCNTPNQGNTSEKYKNNIFKKVKIGDLTTHKNLILYNEPFFHYSEIPKMDNILLNGFFQSEKYFLENKHIIKDLFVFDDEYKNLVEKTLNKIKTKKITGVHVRRGDYLNFKDVHPTCEKEYYEKSMSMLKDTNFIFVSDDIEWCKNNFKGENIFFSEFNDEILDFILLKECDNQIIANSSFSWWSAYLNDNKKKIVISPSRWFGNTNKINDLIPKEWIKI
jgi:hypothetical protein